MKPRAGIILIQDGKLALIRRNKRGRTYYVVPGGGIEEGETKEEAALREAKEELGVEVQIVKEVATLYKERTHYYFLVEMKGGVFGTGEGEEMVNPSPQKGTYTPIWMDVFRLPRLSDFRPSEILPIVMNES
ncbi:DNA mismatch repair protein MutT [Pontibacillus halophilus JSM 076056 = DSM 19796]|uniref:DNA mismatch repair protein MutT n=2 Tax=Pontibacillus TaxID=289201 RepID=A0A0A5GPR1_9BACI|nr:NUDIX domain-containing protein [Pontibacillus halophilus]KGX93959.1 DNA mismatch repair protein MutT [Pontibacillus halophilus JSM 076056 = DSM 19796]